MSTCQTCRYAQKTNHFREAQCRRDAPRMEKVEPSVDLRMFVPVWPLVSYDDWCGQYARASTAELEKR